MCSVSRHARRIAFVDSGASARDLLRDRLRDVERGAVGNDVADEPDLLRLERGDRRGTTSRMSIACVYGIWRGSRHAEPPSGKRPRLASHTPKIALSPATRMSVPCRISVPPATA